MLISLGYPELSREQLEKVHKSILHNHTDAGHMSKGKPRNLQTGESPPEELRAKP